jgi:uncharacterized protein YyaL (SSP411 family)
MANRLAREASPYLKQHAENPVDWYPWGREALDRAKREDKPILLSIGYSACHWCHVMAHECFEDDDIARRMNDHFVNVKVDREERPDLDQIYQLTVQLLGRSGGWPLTVFLTPDQQPFFAGTYFPPVDRHGLPSFPRILESVADAYANKRADIDLQAKEISEAIAQVSAPEKKEGEIPPDVLARAAAKLQVRFDDEHGGFGSRPKFPSTMSLDVLLAHAIANKDDKARARVKRALDGMRDGGIYDQLGGGFHRYSTDERWLVPHFEKMLYDNALLLRLYVDGHRAFHEARYADTAREIVRWLEREMLDARGGFYSTQDADSDGEEGKFFVWTRDEIRAVVGDEGDLVCARFGVGAEGNFEETDSSVLSIAKSIEELAVKFTLAPSDIERRLEHARAVLLAHRDKRVKPFRDEKILASWNGLLVSSLADASRALGEPHWLELAERAFDFVWTHLRKGDRIVRHAEQGFGFLDDQAFVGCAALDLHEATAKPEYLAHAAMLADTIAAAFMDDAGVYLTPKDGETLIARTQDVYDQAVPSATSKALELFARLGRDTRAASSLAKAALENPFGLSSLVLVADRVVNASTEITFTNVDPKSELSAAAWTPIVRNRTIRWTSTGDKVGPNVIVCRGRSCSLPTSTYRGLLSLLSLEGDVTSNV